MPQRPIQARDAVALRFRAATEGDVPALLAMVNESYRVSEHGLFAKERTSRDEVMQAMAAGATVVIAETEDGVMAGSMHLELGAEAHFGLLATARALQGRGVGRALVDEAERQARERGYADMRIECIGEVGLQAWYERLGYTVTRIEREPLASPRSEEWGATRDWSMVHMRKPLT